MRKTGRLAIAVLGALVLCLALGAAGAQAKQVYEYVYSGEYLDGSGSEKGTFPESIVNVAYGTKEENLVVLVKGEEPPSYITQFNKEGLPKPFDPSNIGDTVLVPHSVRENAQIVIDNVAGAANGRIYIFNEGGPIYAFQPNGNLLSSFAETDINSERFGSCGFAIDPQGYLWLARKNGFDGHPELEQFQPNGEATGLILNLGNDRPSLCDIAIDSQGNFYGNVTSFNTREKVLKFDHEGHELSELPGAVGEPTRIAVDTSTDDVYVARLQYLEGERRALITQYDSSGVPLNTFGEPDPGREFPGLDERMLKATTASAGIAIDPTEHNVWVTNHKAYAGNARHVEKFVRTAADITVPTTTTEAPSLSPTSAILRGTLNADGVDTTACQFEWGATVALGHSVPCDQGSVFTGSEDSQVSASVSGLTKGNTYFVRLSAMNGNGRLSPGATLPFIAQGKPILGVEYVDHANTDGVQLNAEIDPNGGRARYSFEWGTTEGYGASSAEVGLKHLLDKETVKSVITGLAPDTTYHYRVVVRNEAGTITGEDREFTTYSPVPAFDPCPNAEVRRQSGASLLLDCRGYELVSAAAAGGYDVESDLVPGQAPFDAHPRANGAVLYGLHFGSVPGIAGSPTNFGLDPYVATRGANGWSTRYVGLPSDGMAEQGAFGSPLLEADPSLTEFAFGGPDICSPCFEDGSTNIPFRFSDGTLGKGMVGSRSPAAEPSGYVAQRFSGNGEHFVFSSRYRFEASAKNGEPTIYDRDLSNNTTQVVSTLPNGTVMTASEGENGELAISKDGARIITGQIVTTDVAGNAYWHPYMHVGTDTHSIDLLPGTTAGVQPAGLSANGRAFFFTTTESLSGSDEDSSADLYEADVSEAGTVTYKLLSGGLVPPVGNTDACEPAENAVSNHWNAVGTSSPASCGVVAIAGGGGVAPENGTTYFLSPEALDGHGEAGKPNLFVTRPGAFPRFVATLEAESPLVKDAAADPDTYRYGDFQTTPDGHYAIFSSYLPLLPKLVNFGHSLIYRYDINANGGAGALACISCAPTGAAPAGDAFLSPHGLNLADDGRVFFTSSEPYVLRDTNEREDAYEWKSGDLQLISTGSSPEDSTLYSVGADGRDAFFFTRQTLVHGDENGGAVRIYDAREAGGFLYEAPPFPCAASDECHGPGTPTAPPPSINTVTGSGRASTVSPPTTRCRKGRARRHGHCVKRRHKPRHRRHAHHRHQSRSNGS